MKTQSEIKFKKATGNSGYYVMRGTDNIGHVFCVGLTGWEGVVNGKTIAGFCNTRKAMSDMMVARFDRDAEVKAAAEVKPAVAPTTAPTSTLTTMETAVLGAYLKTEYGDGPGTDTWVFSIIDHSGVPGVKARGVLSSLVKKGLITIGGYDKDASTNLTDAGIAALKELAPGITCVVCGQRRPVCCSMLICADGTRLEPKCAACCDHKVATPPVPTAPAEDGHIMVCNRCKRRPESRLVLTDHSGAVCQDCMRAAPVQATGYTSCACRDCMELAIGADGATMCRACITADCELDGECQSPGAYGGDETEPQPEEDTSMSTPPTTIEALTSDTGSDASPTYYAVAREHVDTCRALKWAWISIRAYVLAVDCDPATAHHLGVQRAGHDDVLVLRVGGNDPWSEVQS